MKRKLLTIAISLTIATTFIGCDKITLGKGNESSKATATVTPIATSTPEATASIDTAIKPEDTSNDEASTDVISDNDAVMKDSRLFYYNFNENKLYYIDKKIPVEDNAYVKALTEAIQKSPDSANLIALSDEACISSASLDNETGVLKVVFNEDYSLDMNMDSAKENGLLRALIATYGYNYDVTKVAIYLGEQLYTAELGDPSQGYLDIDINDAVEFNKN